MKILSLTLLLCTWCHLVAETEVSNQITNNKIEATKVSVRAEIIDHIKLLKEQLKYSKSKLERYEGSEWGTKEYAEHNDRRLESWRQNVIQTEHEIILSLSELAKISD